MLRSIESLGIASVYGINYFGRGSLSNDNYVSYVRHEALGRDLLNGSLTYVPNLKTFYTELTRTMPDYGLIKARWIQFHYFFPDSYFNFFIRLISLINSDVTSIESGEMKFWRTIDEPRTWTMRSIISILWRRILMSFENYKESYVAWLGNPD